MSTIGIDMFLDLSLRDISAVFMYFVASQVMFDRNWQLFLTQVPPKVFFCRQAIFLGHFSLHIHRTKRRNKSLLVSVPPSLNEIHSVYEVVCQMPKFRVTPYSPTPVSYYRVSYLIKYRTSSITYLLFACFIDQLFL